MGQKEAGTRVQDGDQLQHTLWEEGVHPGVHLPTGMERELEAGIAGASLGQGLAGLILQTGAVGSPSRSLQMPWHTVSLASCYLFALDTCGCNQPAPHVPLFL